MDLQLSGSTAFSRKAFMGFDGYVDTIVRILPDERSTFRSMNDLGAFLHARGERSGTLSLDRIGRRFGGNMPICAHALGTLGIAVDCVGALGDGHPHPVFSGLSKQCRLFPLVDPGECTAVEFEAGKLFLADHGDVGSLDYALLAARLGFAELVDMVASCGLIGFFNWGELPNMQQVWSGFLDNVFPRLEGKGRILFFDLSDCSARSPAELMEVLLLLKRFRAHGLVVLSLNDNECLQLARVVDGAEGEGDARACACPDTWQDEGTALFDEALETLFRSGSADLIVHHGMASAAVRSQGGLQRTFGEKVEMPRIITGGGDHFNAGFAYGLLGGLPPLACAVLGNHVSRLFVTEGVSPDERRLRNDPAVPREMLDLLFPHDHPERLEAPESPE